MTMPNFLLMGAAKAGTTALYQYLKQHPQIYMSPVKEPHFFAYEGRKPNTQGPGDTANDSIITLKEYLALFESVRNERAIGEASTMYLYLPQACERIRYYLPDARLIAILRHPAERAYSAFIHLVREGRETLTNFSQALQSEEERIRQNWGPLWHLTRCGFYYEQVKRYFDTFPREQIKIYLYDDFKARPTQVVQDIFRFLKVDDSFQPDMSVRVNISGIPKSRSA